MSQRGSALRLLVIGLVLLHVTRAAAERVFLLSVGNSHSRSLRPNDRQKAGWVDFDGPESGVASAERIASIFSRAGAEYSLLLTSAPGKLITRSDVFGALDQVIQKATRARSSKTRPLIVVYIAGHGISEGVGWSHFSVPGDFAGRIDWTDLEGMSQRLVYAGDLFDRLARVKLDFLLLLDSCYEGKAAHFAPEVLTPRAADNLNSVLAVLRDMNEFRGGNPVLFSTTPGTVVAEVPDPDGPTENTVLAPLARRFTIIDGKTRGSSVRLSKLVKMLTLATLDAETRPAVTRSQVGRFDPEVLAAARTSGKQPERIVGTGDPNAAAAAVAASEPAPRTVKGQITLKSPPGEYVGGGQARICTPTDMPWKLIQDTTDAIELEFWCGAQGWSLELSGRDGRPLTRGKHDRAQRAPFQAAGHPGLSVGGDGRGCNELSGSFEITRLRTTPDGKRVIGVDADFVQYCDGAADALRGHVTFDVRA